MSWSLGSATCHLLRRRRRRCIRILARHEHRSSRRRRRRWVPWGVVVRREGSSLWRWGCLGSSRRWAGAGGPGLGGGGVGSTGREPRATAAAACSSCRRRQEGGGRTSSFHHWHHAQHADTRTRRVSLGFRVESASIKTLSWRSSRPEKKASKQALSTLSFLSSSFLTAQQTSPTLYEPLLQTCCC
jgi:hypothetical protein